MQRIILNKNTYTEYEIQIKNFTSTRFPKGESFLRYNSNLYLEEFSKYRIYIIINEDLNNEIVAFFALSTASLFWVGNSLYPAANPGVEIVYFSVNDAYTKYKRKNWHIGQMIFSKYILTTIKEISNYIGTEYIMLFSLPIDKVIESYERMGFNQADDDITEYIRYYSVKDCKLMVYNLKTLNS